MVVTHHISWLIHCDGFKSNLKATVALIHFAKSQHDSDFKYCHLFSFFLLTYLFPYMNTSSEQMVEDYQ